MPHFPVKVENMRVLINRKGKKYFSKVDLSDEWAIIFFYRPSSTKFKCFAIEIQHKTITDEEFSARGMLSLVKRNLVVFHKDFSIIIKTRTEFTEIISESPIFTNSSTIGILLGIVYIDNINEKCSDVSAKCPLKVTNAEMQLRSMLKLSEDFVRLLDPKTSSFSDVVFKCGDVSIPAHKNILSVRSPVFSAMFSNPVKESHKNEVNIIDIDENTVRNLLTYIYTGKISGWTVSLASHLLVAAHKYQLQGLKPLCCDFLKNNMSLQNVLNILVLGELLDGNLKSFAMEYISTKCPNFSAIEDREDWKKLRKDRPALAMDVLTCLIKSKEGTGNGKN